MTITLTAEIEELLDQQLKSGLFRSAEEAVLLGLQILNEQRAKHAELRRMMETARDNIAQGNYTLCETDEELDAFAEDLIRQVEGRQSQAQASRQ